MYVLSLNNCNFTGILLIKIILQAALPYILNKCLHFRLTTYLINDLNIQFAVNTSKLANNMFYIIRSV